MKYRAILSLILLPQLVAPVLAATYTMKDDDSLVDAEQWSMKDEIVDKLEDLKDITAMLGMRIAAKIPQFIEKGFEIEREMDTEDDESPDFDYMMPTCVEQDCKKSYFVNETMRWVKQALRDAGVFIYENRAATIALLIGVSVLVANMITGGMLMQTALQAIGFGSKGPIKKSIAAVMQSKAGRVQMGVVFSKLQSAAMGGAAMEELHKIATVAVAGLIGAGAVQLVGAGTKARGQSGDFNPKEWKAWELESKFNKLPKGANNWAQYWGNPTSEGCIAYGYREIRAPLWFVREGEEPLATCVRTRALINGTGYRTPLGCVDEGPKKGVVGMWYVPTNETRCMPHWSEFEDEGCMLYGRRRKFARLMGLKGKDDWNSVCESTPASIDYKHYDGPSYCENKGILGIYGVFNIADKQCECSCVRL